jgi:hypothetical protein
LDPGELIWYWIDKKLRYTGVLILFPSPSTEIEIKCGILVQTRHARLRNKNAYKMFVERPLRKPSRRIDDDIEMAVREISFVDVNWIRSNARPL